MATAILEIESNMTLHKMLDNTKKVEVPIIQRDYAQGRKNVKEIRNDFLKDIFLHLKDDKPMKLSFVYGTKNETIYVPYDGQQRLTLVYLVSLYLAAYSKNWDGIKTLSKFNYYTRDHATAFCDFLTTFESNYQEGQKNVFQRIDIYNCNNLALEIKNDSTFFGTWQYEPTVSSMLVVLQAIHEEFVNNTEGLDIDLRIVAATNYLKAIEDGKIFFDWCPIQASDNIYIKMNGRGKPLSAFDNFKNTLYAELDKLRKQAIQDGFQEKVNFLKEFEIKMDGVWTDVFWKKRNVFLGQENYDIAPFMMNFLYYIFELRHFVSSESFFFGGKESFKWIDEKNVVTFLNKFKDLCHSDAQGKKGKITIDDYIWASKLLDIISLRLQTPGVDTKIGIESYKDEEQLLQELSSHMGRVASVRTVIVATFYYEYLVAVSEFDTNGKLVNYDITHRSEWIRLISRLIRTAAKFKARYDALIRDKHILAGYSNVFIKKIFENNASGDLRIGAANITKEDLSAVKKYFNASHVYSQLAEEIRKYQLMNIDSSVWEPLLMKAENELGYLENMIYFLIQLAEDSNGSIDSSEFNKYLSTTQKVFDANGVINQNKFSAILLSYADYRISSGEGRSNSWSLCSNESNEGFSWRNFFDVLDGDIAQKGIKKSEIIKSAMDYIEKYNDIESAYNALTKNNSCQSWKDVVICYPEILMKGSKHRIVYYDKDSGRWFLIRSEGVVKQVHTNSLYDSIDLELFGIYKEANSDKIKFNNTRIEFGSDYTVRKDDKIFVIKDANGEVKMDYADTLAYLRSV